MGIACLIFVQKQAVAGEVTKNQALTVAENVVRQFFPAGRQSLPVAIQQVRTSEAEALYYICNVGDQGFVLVAKNDNCPPVLGFSWESNFPVDQDAAPEWMRTLVQNIKNQCDKYIKCDTLSQAIADKWQSFSSKKSATI